MLHEPGCDGGVPFVHNQGGPLTLLPALLEDGVLYVFWLFPLWTVRSSQTRFHSVPSLSFSPVLFVESVQTLQWWDGDVIRYRLQGDVCGEMWFCWWRLTVWEWTAWSCEQVCQGYLLCFWGFLRKQGCLACFMCECPEGFLSGSYFHFRLWISGRWVARQWCIIVCCLFGDHWIWGLLFPDEAC